MCLRSNSFNIVHSMNDCKYALVFCFNVVACVVCMLIC
jgi:hypothetical protein